MHDALIHLQVAGVSPYVGIAAKFSVVRLDAAWFVRGNVYIDLKHLKAYGATNVRRGAARRRLASQPKVLVLSSGMHARARLPRHHEMRPPI